MEADYRNNTLVLQAPAKVNLCLKVLNKREDQYHNLSSLIQMVGLYDLLIFQEKEEGIQLQVNHDTLASHRRNLVQRAAELLQQEMQAEQLPLKGVSIVLDKNIPIAAGLGGGSSDAAAALVGLNRLWSLNWPREKLSELGSRLGSDIPFFFYGPTAWVSGRGEQVEAIQPVFEGWILLIHPEISVSTARVFENYEKAFGLTKGDAPPNITPTSVQRPTIEEIMDHPTNDLEKVTLYTHPDLSEIKNLLRKLGGEGVLMSGSGPSIFGLFREQQSAITASREIEKQWKYPVSVLSVLTQAPF